MFALLNEESEEGDENFAACKRESFCGLDFKVANGSYCFCFGCKHFSERCLCFFFPPHSFSHVFIRVIHPLPFFYLSFFLPSPIRRQTEKNAQIPVLNVGVLEGGGGGGGFVTGGGMGWKREMGTEI